jgi:hypothetical protein
VNSKQAVAAVSVVVLIVILVYPALSTGTVSILLQSTKIERADHVFVSIGSVWMHRAGQSSPDEWELVSNQSQTVDLTSLATSRMVFAKGQAPLGAYDSIRIEVSNVTWVFNNTSTRLSVQVPQLLANLNFNTQAGRVSTITLVLAGHEEELQSTKFFVPNLNATLGGVPGP